MSDLCEDCGSEMTEEILPNGIFQFNIPFTGLQVQINKWETIFYCMPCVIDADSRRNTEMMESAYNQGCQDSYMESQ